MNHIHHYLDEGSTIATTTRSGRRLVTSTDVDAEGRIAVYVFNPYGGDNEWDELETFASYSEARRFMESAY